LRVTPELKQRLDAAAEASGRSQSQEAEFRLERSFDRTDLLAEVLTLAYGEEAAALLREAGDLVHSRRVRTDILRQIIFDSYAEFLRQAETPNPFAGEREAVKERVMRKIEELQRQIQNQERRPRRRRA
jgi:predicted transcriptional regulator